MGQRDIVNTFTRDLVPSAKVIVDMDLDGDKDENIRASRSFFKALVVMSQVRA